MSQGDHGPPRGRELELADILSFIRNAKRIRNTVWITADVHHAAAYHYDPNKAAFQDFEPFWEFVAGPLNAGTGRVLPPGGRNVWAAGHIHQGREPDPQDLNRRAELWPAVLRSRCDRWHDWA